MRDQRKVMGVDSGSEGEGLDDFPSRKRTTAFNMDIEGIMTQ